MSFLRELQQRNVFKVGAGYAVVAWVLIQVAGEILPTFDTPRWVLQVITLALIVGFPVSLVLAWAFELTPGGILRDDGRHSAPGSGVTTAGDTANRDSRATKRKRLQNSVAVLPFENLSPNPDDSYFAAGLHDEILNQLTKIAALNVIARTSVVQYARTQKSISEIANELNVETVMEGSVRFAGDRVRVTTQLIDATSDAHMWSETYERPFKDIFAIESDIAINVANAMQATFSAAERREIEKIPTTSPAAYGLYLRARHIVYTGGGEAERAHQLLDRAIQIDPRFARAYGLKAMIYAASFVNTEQRAGVGATDRETLEQEVRSWAEKAFAIDPKNPEARAAIRTLSILTWHWSDFEQAMEPGDETSLVTFGLWFYSWRGQREYAVQLGEKIAKLNPNDAAVHMSLGVVYAYAGDRDASNEAFRKMLEMAPEIVLGHTFLAFNEIAMGNSDRALEELRLEEELLGDDTRRIVFLPDLAYCYSRIGHHDDAKRILQELETLGRTMDLGAGTWATAYLAMGDEKRALEQLELVAQKARNHETDQGFLNVMSLRMNHLDDPTLKKPEFVEVFSRIKGD